MKSTTRLLTLLTLLVAATFLFGTAVYAGNDEGGQKGFVDLNGDGFNDNMKDDDGDGIPNCIDEDYVKECDGEGTMTKSGNTYAYNFQYKLQPKHMVQSRHMVFSERKAMLEGVTPEDPMGNAGSIGQGSFNPGMNETAIKNAPETTGKHGTE
ncbi:MAG: hypothetical protein AB1483_03795 [Candidatus Zixiibacteriota bacterium]